MTIHFCYAGNPDNGEIQSPYCITHNLFYFLKARTNVVYHDWMSGDDIDIQPDDIILGHPNYDKNTVIQKAFRNQKPCRAKCLIFPLHTNRVEDNWPFNDLVQKATHVFSICGPYWYDTLHQTQFASWKPKITRLDMAADLNHFAHIKKTFHDPGQRRLVYVGSCTPHKNLEYMRSIMNAMHDVQLDWYGGSNCHQLAKLKNVRVDGWCRFTKEKLAEVCERSDIFLNTSYSDANPTTLTELCLASGLIPICTKESGYHNSPHFINIPLNDIRTSISIIRRWLNEPTDVLNERSRVNREFCEKNHSWDVFCNTIWDVLKRYVDV